MSSTSGGGGGVSFFGFSATIAWFPWQPWGVLLLEHGEDVDPPNEEPVVKRSAFTSS
jgi:hypothetical protein